MKNLIPLNIISRAQDNQDASYESLLDLFTLLSFVLLIAAFLYTSQQIGRDTSSSNVEAYIAGRGSGESATIPDNLTLLILYKDQGQDKIMLIEGATSESTYLIDDNTIKTTLNEILPILQRANEIYITLHSKEEIPSPSIWLSIQIWLSENKFNNYKIYFTGNYG